jgi:hypothetical protein
MAREWSHVRARWRRNRGAQGAHRGLARAVWARWNAPLHATKILFRIVCWCSCPRVQHCISEHTASCADALPLTAAPRWSRATPAAIGQGRTRGFARMRSAASLRLRRARAWLVRLKRPEQMVDIDRTRSRQPFQQRLHPLHRDLRASRQPSLTVWCRRASANYIC